MKSILTALKSKPVAASIVMMIALQLFISASIMVTVMFTDVSVRNAASNVEGVGSFVIGAVIAEVLGIILLLICLSRVRTFYIIAFNVVAFFATLFGFIGLGMAGIPIPPVVMIISLFVFWQYFLVYGLGYIFFYRFRSVGLTIMSNSFWFFSLILVSMSDRLVTTNDLTAETVSNNLGLLWQGPEVILVIIYLFLTALLLLVDTQFHIARWQRDLGSKINIRKRNYVVFLGLVIVTILLTTIFGAQLWRARWETEYREQQIDAEKQRPNDFEQRELPPQIGDGGKGGEEGQQQNPGGQLPSQSPAGQDVPFAAIRYGDVIGEDYLDRESEKTSEELAPDFVKFTQIESAPGEDVDNIGQVPNVNPQYFRSEIYDSYTQEYGFSRNYAWDYFATDGPEVRGFYYKPNLHEFPNSRELYQTIALLGGDTQLAFGATDVFEVGYLGDRPSPYFFGYQNGVVVTSGVNNLRRGDQFYVLSRVNRIDRSDPSGVAQLKIKPHPSVRDSNNIVTPTYAYLLNDNELRVLSMQITSSDRGYYAQVSAIEDFLRENYEYDPSLDNVGDLIDSQQKVVGDGEVQFTQVESLPGNSPDADTENIVGKITKADVKHFLQSNPGTEENKGSSTMFAASFTVLLENIPASSYSRVVGGFRTEQYEAEIDAYLISTQDIHYWNEVYFPEVGWVTIDVLAGIKPENPEQELTPEEQQEIGEDLGQGEERISERGELRDDLRRGNSSENNFGQSDSSPDTASDYQAPDLSALGGALQTIWFLFTRSLLVLCPLGLLILLTFPPGYKYARWKYIFSSSDEKSDEERIKAYYKNLQRLMKYFGMAQKPTETNRVYVERIKSEYGLLDTGLERFAYLHNRVLFAKSISPNAGEEAEGLAQKIASDVIKLKRQELFQATYLRW